MSISGRTIHSWLGVNSGYKFDKEELWKSIRKNKEFCNTLKSVKVIFIDEISVLKDKVIDSIDLVMRFTAENTRMACMPMGGRQLVLAGDPF